LISTFCLKHKYYMCVYVYIYIYIYIYIFKERERERERACTSVLNTWQKCIFFNITLQMVSDSRGEQVSHHATRGRTTRIAIGRIRRRWVTWPGKTGLVVQVGRYSTRRLQLPVFRHFRIASRRHVRRISRHTLYLLTYMLWTTNIWMSRQLGNINDIQQYAIPVLEWMLVTAHATHSSWTWTWTRGSLHCRLYASLTSKTGIFDWIHRSNITPIFILHFWLTGCYNIYIYIHIIYIYINISCDRVWWLWVLCSAWYVYSAQHIWTRPMRWTTRPVVQLVSLFWSARGICRCTSWRSSWLQRSRLATRLSANQVKWRRSRRGCCVTFSRRQVRRESTRRFFSPEAALFELAMLPHASLHTWFYRPI